MARGSEGHSSVSSPQGLLEDSREFQGQCTACISQRSTELQTYSFFYIINWRKGYYDCTPRLFFLCKLCDSLSYLFQASGPAAPDEGPSFARALPPEYLLCPFTLFIPLHDCPSSGPLNQFSCFLSHPDKPNSSGLPM